MFKLLFSSLFILSSFASLAEARRDQRREARQQGRIAGGVKSGELTKKEAYRLHKGQKRIDRAQRRAKADGVVTAKEQAGLEKRQDYQSAQIYKQKHDDQKRQSAGSAELPDTPE